MFVVTVMNGGMKFWLRSTTWAFNIDRADKFSTRDAAKEAAVKAEKFMAQKIKKSYNIEEI